MKNIITKFSFINLLFIFIFIFSMKAYALSCTYSSSNEGYKLETNKIKYRIDKLTYTYTNFNLVAKETQFSKKSLSMDDFQTEDFEYASYDTKISIYDFSTGDENSGKWKCPELYFYAEVNTGTGLHTYKVATDPSKGIKLNLIDSSGVGDSLGEEIKEEVESGDWDNVCRYGPYLLKISKTSFDLNINKDFVQFDINDLAKLQYQCPYYLCGTTATTDTYYDIYTYDASKGSAGMTYCYEAISVTGGCVIFNDLVDAYNENSNSQNSKKLKDYCAMQVENNDYNHVCVKSCLNLSDVLKEIESSNTDCGLSSRLIGWIFNIVKWLKYIIPVIVIVLGILDFIKAMSSEKDDEMKKSQGRFVKRLIAAALIFLVPFIIEFILDKMGFEVTGCGIIKELQ